MEKYYSICVMQFFIHPSGESKFHSGWNKKLRWSLADLINLTIFLKFYKKGDKLRFNKIK